MCGGPPAPDTPRPPPSAVRYPQSWHYQTDGWLSPDSAAVYDTSTETLFIGRQDAMQRCCGLALLARHLRSPAAGDEVDPFRPPRVLDVACGTGRLLSFVRDAFPDAQARPAAAPAVRRSLTGATRSALSNLSPLPPPPHPQR